MPNYYQDPQQEITWIEGLQRAGDQASLSASQWNQINVMRANHVAKVAPWVPPGVLLAIAKGTDTLDGLQNIAMISAQQRAQDNPSNRNVGDPLYGRELNPGDRRLFNGRPVGPNINMEQREAKDTSPAFSPNAPIEIRQAAELGLIDHANQIHMPKNHSQQGAFDDLIRYVQDHSPKDNQGFPADVPVLNKHGKLGIYSPEFQTWTDAPQDPHASIGPFGMVGEQLGRGLGNLTNKIASFRANPIHAPGTGGMTVGQAVSGSAKYVGQQLQTHQPAPEVPVFTGSAADTRAAMTQTEGLASMPKNFNEAVQRTNALMTAPLQEVNGVVRNVYGSATGRDVNWWEPQSDLGVWAQTGMSPGKGFFVDPDSAVGQERLRREQERGLIDGHTFTLGRGIMHAASSLGMVEPDSAAYNIFSGIVDGAFALKADPLIWGSNKLEAIQEARHLLIPDAAAEKTGLIKGLWTNDIWRPRVGSFLDGPDGSKLMQRLADEPNAGIVWRGLGRKVSKELATSIADAHSPEEVRAIMEPKLGGQFRSTRDLWTDPRVMDPNKFTMDSAKAWGQRMLTDIPGYFVNPYDDQSVMGQTEAWLTNSHVKPSIVNHFLDRAARASSPSEVLDELKQMMLHTDGVLAQEGVPQELRKQLVQRWDSDLRTAQKKQLDAALDHIQSLDEVKMGDDIFGTGSPLLWAEQQSQMISLPDSRAFRRLSTEMPNMAWDAEGQLKWPLAKIEDFQSKVWKPFQLIRLAWPVRVISDEQARMAASGFPSFFKNQASYIALALGRKEALTLDPFDAAQDFQKAMTRGTAGFLEEAPNRARTGAKVVFQRGDDGFNRAWGHEIADLHLDPITQRITEHGLADTQDWLFNGAGRPLYDEMVAKHPALERQGVRDTWLEGLGRRVHMKANGNNDLLDAIRTGEYKGIPIFDKATMSVPDDFIRAIGEPGTVAGSPDKVVGYKDIGHNMAKKDPFVTRAFSLLMTKPSNYLSRSPTFRQAYWDRILEMMPFAAPEEKARIIENAKQAYQVDVGPITLGKGYISKLEKSKTVGKLTLEEMDSFAKGHALDTVQDLLYDLSRKSQIADSMRLVSPFAEAWKEVYSVWGKLLNPATGQGLKNIRRATQLYQQALSPELGGLFGAPKDLSGHQQGLFWRDEFGDMNFVFPGTQWLTGQKWLHVPDWVPGAGGFGAPGIPVPMTGRVAGLAMFGSVVPGLGPVAAVPASYFLPDKPGWTRTLRDVLLPFGSMTDQQGITGLGQVLNFAPSWMRNGIMALAGHGLEQQSNRLYANTQMSVANYLYSTGKYDTTSQAGWQKLMDDAKKASRNLYLVKSLVGFGAPSAPRTDFLTNTNRGLVRYAALRDLYITMLADPKIGPTSADEKFLDQFGDHTGMTMQSFTREVQGGVGVSRQFEDWANTHKDLQTEFPNTWAYFGPQKGKFDYNVYLRQIVTGKREQLTPDEWRRVGENHLGQMVLDNAKAKIGPNPDDGQQAYLSDLKDWVYKNYPGFNDFRGVEGRSDPEVVMRELEQAVQDPRVTKTQAGKALVEYMKARDGVMADVTANGDRTFQGQAYTGSRQFLFDTGQYYAQHMPDFRAIWNRVLRNEVEPEVTASNAG